MFTPERWQRVQALCEALETVEPPDRIALLESLERDETLRVETLAILDAMRAEQAYTAGLTGANARDDTHRASIGGMQVLGRVGAGGSGEVFRALRRINGTEQVVAVKLFHPHRAGPEHLERFAREQQMLAALTHPDIVRFLDGGVTGDGRPYLVMELAEGEPLTDYCDSRRLKLAERIRLFVSVCDAVQSAHRHLIVHLDLKPSNILVSGDGRVKLLDFGTAKLVDPAAGHTRTEPLTLLYASPERLRGEPVSVACDVYSLGLILFELISGAWPFQGRESIMSVAERAAGRTTVVPLARKVSAEAAERRGTTVERLTAAVRGDLDAIVQKTLASAPGERYASVADLAEDLRRYLAGEPVRARPLGVAYRFGKFLRRHRWETAAIVALIAGLAGAAIYAAGQARTARLAAEHAQTQNRFLTSLFTLAGTDSASRHDMTVRELLDLAERRIAPALGSNPGIAADVQVTLALGYVSQSAFAQARTLLEQAVERSATIGDLARESIARANLAYVMYVQDEREAAADMAMKALTLWREQPARFTPGQSVMALRVAATTLTYVATTDPRPREYFERCVAIADASPAEVARVDSAMCLYGLATLYVNVDSRYAEADALLRQVLRLEQDEMPLGLRATVLQMLGLTNRYRGEYVEDERAQREAYELIARLQGADSVAALWQRAVWIASLPGVGRSEEAYRESTELLAAARTVYPTRAAYLLWTPLFSASYAACMTERFDECDALAREAIETLGAHPDPNDGRLHTAGGFLGLALARRGRHDEAKPLLDRAIAMNTARKRQTPYDRVLADALGRR